MFGCAPGDNSALLRAAGEIDALDLGRVDQRTDNVSGVGGRVGHKIDDAVREASFDKRLVDQCVGAWARFTGLQDNGIAAGQRHRDRPDAENDRSVPRRDAEDHTDRFLQRHGNAARLVRGDDFAGNLGGDRRRLPHDGCREFDVEHCPAKGRAGLGHHRRGKSFPAGQKSIGGFHQQRAPRARPLRRPGGKSCRSPRRNGGHVGGFHRRR